MTAASLFAPASGLKARHERRMHVRAPRTAKSLIFVLAGLFAAALLWANRTELQELARAEGEIVPAGRLLHIEHYDGGVIEEVRVRQGDRVEAGEVLARLSSPTLGKTEAELQQELVLLTTRDEMLRALLRDAPDPDTRPDAYAAARRELHESRREMLMQRVQSRDEALAIARSARDVAEQRVALSERELDRLKTLQDKGYVAQTAVSEQEDQLQAIRGDLLAASNALARAVGEQADAVAAVHEADLGYRQELQEEIFEATQQIERIEGRLAELDERRARLVVTAPEAGIVQLAALTSPGEVVDAGEKMFEILPTSERLMAEIRLTPGDIGHVSVGDAVTIKPDRLRRAPLRGARGADRHHLAHLGARPRRAALLQRHRRARHHRARARAGPRRGQLGHGRDGRDRDRPPHGARIPAQAHRPLARDVALRALRAGRPRPAPSAGSRARQGPRARAAAPASCPRRRPDATACPRGLPPSTASRRSASRVAARW